MTEDTVTRGLFHDICAGTEDQRSTITTSIMNLNLINPGVCYSSVSEC